MKKIIIDNLITIIYAMIIAVLIRSLLLQPFYIPSSSMEPSLLVGDRLFVTKLSYGYSKHSFPFSLGPIKNRILFSEPNRGDVIVFKTPADNRTDYIKRLIGLPGDKLQFIGGNLYLNDVEILKSKVVHNSKIYCGKSPVETFVFKEKLLNGKEYLTSYYKNDWGFCMSHSEKKRMPRGMYRTERVNPPLARACAYGIEQIASPPH